MPIKSNLISFVFAAATIPFISVGSAQADEMCTVKTARQSVSSNTLCGCDVVSSRMLRYIQRRADFESILERTLIDCPAFAAVLTDLPTASANVSEQRSGDGSSDESTERDSGTSPDPSDNNPGGSDPGDDTSDPSDDKDPPTGPGSESKDPGTTKGDGST